ncbi:MAG: DUF2203 domain-containing protein [Chloroflexi bacterium]|nr:DUF2203 domain-containing protein [Chloroflexota bacterium]
MLYYTDAMMERLFTYEEANELVPWLEERFDAIAPMRDELVDRQEALLGLLRRRRSNGHSSSEEEIAAAEGVVTRLTRQLQDAVKEITDRGILVRDVGRGLVDFPSDRENETVYLCWLRGEPSIDWWHPTNTGFAGRRPL